MRPFIILLLACSFAATAQDHAAYPPADSALATRYYNASWKYRIGSLKHQLYLDSAIAVIPSIAYYWQQKAMPLYKAGKTDLGRPFLDSAVKYAPAKWLDYRALMEVVYEKDFIAALRDFTLAKARYGNRILMDHTYDFYIGLCHLQLNNYDSSEQYFTTCIAQEEKTLGPKWVHYNLLFYRAIVCYEKEQYEQAMGYLDRALGQYPQFSDAQYYKSLCLYNMHRQQEALALMETASANNKEGYTMNEDNALYEYYPYQVRRYYFSSSLAWMRDEAAKK